MSRIFLGLYSAVWRVATPFLRRHKRLADGFEQRLVPRGWPFAGEDAERGQGGSFTGEEAEHGQGGHDSQAGKPDRGAPLIWVQAASGGEAWLVHELVAGLAVTRPQGMPDVRLLCTSCTGQGLEILRKIPKTPGIEVITAFFPLDRPAIMRQAVEQARPSLIVLLETELWPGLLGAAGRAKIPVLVLNGRITEKSLSGYKWLAGFWKKHAPGKVLAISSDDGGRFGGLFSPEIVEVMPNIKFDGVARQCAVLADNAGLRMTAGFPEGETLFVLASVRQEEEELLLPEIKKMLASGINYGNVTVVVAPRHMHRVENWLSILGREGILAALFSGGMSGDGGGFAGPAGGPQSPRVVVWDVFGRLNELYAMADAVFVGGSLVPLGGQNFLEPLAQGVRPCIGEFWKNFHWVGRDIFTAGLVEMLPGPGSLAAALERMAADFSLCGAGENGAAGDLESLRLRRRIAVNECFSQWLGSRLGGSRQAARCIWEFVQKTRGTSSGGTARPETLFPSTSDKTACSG